MSQIYVVDESDKKLHCVESVSFADIGVKERADLQSWVIDNPDILGEELLVIATEYFHFDKSNRRIDILALDSAGVLVIVELKLVLSKSFADQQAVRYAAFCSTMAMADAVSALAISTEVSEPEAEEAIRKFLNKDELPELNNRPRIILAGGALDDQELAATVLWLRTFGLDITCVEMAPYRLPGSGQVMVVPRIVIPIPQARDYQISVERKEAKKLQDSTANHELSKLWLAIAEEFNDQSPSLKVSSPGSKLYMQLRIGHSHVHYEWMRRTRDDALDVCLHFEASDRDWNISCAREMEKREADICEGLNLEFYAGAFGKNWAEIRLRVKYDGTEELDDIKIRASSTMLTLVERTFPIVKEIIKS